MRIFLLPLFIALVIDILADIYIYKQLAKIQGRVSNILKSSHLALSLILGAAAIFLAVAPRHFFSGHQNYLAIGIYYYATILTAKVIYMIFAFILQLFIKRKARRFAHIIATIAACGVLCEAMMATFHTRYDVNINHVTLTFDDLPEQFDGYRIAQFSDFHVDSYGSDTTFVEKAVRAINAEHPDITLFTGDLVSGKADEVTPFLGNLRQLHAPDGVISILGNHDYSDYCIWTDTNDKKADHAKLINYERSIGWDLLLNETRNIRRGNDSIMIIGVENIAKPPFITYGDLKKSYPSLKDNNFKILLSHNPTHWKKEVVTDSNIQLTLSGHTHAMQMAIHIFGKDFSPSAFIYKEWEGLYHTDSSQYLYVNTGLGCVGMPARFGVKPEITIITLKCNQ